MTWSTAQQKCLCTDAHSTGNKQEELEAVLQITSYNLVAVTETCREESHDWSITDDGLKLFRRDGQGRRGGRVALDIKNLI